jgi:tRNA-Thr(GGU) m(6)t(6)A37 methyltransferase TsaA
METAWLGDLLRHLGWADAALWRAVLENDVARGDEKIRLWLHHVHAVQHLFLRSWRGEPLGLPELAAFADPPAIARWGREAHAGIEAFLQAAGPEALAREMRLPWVEGLELARDRSIEHPSLAHTAVQIAMHSAHHRGQVAARLRVLGGEPPLNDFIAWLWWGRPEADWSSPEDAAVRSRPVSDPSGEERWEGSGPTVTPIGWVRSPLTDREHAPKQGHEGAPEAWLVFGARFREGLRDLRAGKEVLVLTWLDRADRETLEVHPRDDEGVPLHGVFSTRSQDRPNPIGLHRVGILEVVDGLRFRVRDIEALDGTPILDVKPVLDRLLER